MIHLNPAQTITRLLEDLPTKRALCAFNCETLPMVRAAFRAAAQTSCPIVIAYSQPAAEHLGYETTANLVALIGGAFPEVAYALHLDHCHDPKQVIAAVADGFASANFLTDDTDVALGAYLADAQQLRAELGGKISLEFIYGTLGHIDDAAHAPQATSVDDIVAFAAACGPDILGFDHGSLHGMRERTRHLDLELIGRVADATDLPQVLHGSSGVLPREIRAGIDAGIRKINIETALRATYMDAIGRAVNGDSHSARKPRILESDLEDTMTAQFTGLLTDYTLRKA